MDKSSVEKKIEAYRSQYKKVSKKKDKDFDQLVKSYPDPNNALSYLRGFVGIR